MEIPALEMGLSGRKHWILFRTSPSELELLNQDYRQLSPPTPDFRAHSSPGPSFFLEQLAKCCSSLETWKFSPDNSLNSSNQALDPSPPPKGTRKLLQQSGSGASSCQLQATCRILHEMAQGERKWKSMSSQSLATAYTTAAEVRADVGLNPLGTGTRSPGFNY